jgi:hypothetical protein
MEQSMYTFFGRTASLAEHLQSLINTNSVTLPYGREELTETGKLLKAVLEQLEHLENMK